MQIPLHLSRHLFQLPLFLLSCSTGALAFTQQQFNNTFNFDPPTAGGGCGRTAPNGVSMMDYSVNAVGDAFDMAMIVLRQLGHYSLPTANAVRLRGLLFLFFGITFTTPGYQLDPSSWEAFVYVESAGLLFSQPATRRDGEIANQLAGVFIDVNALLYNQQYPPGGRPWFHCLEDYAFYTQHLVGRDGLENMSAPLAAVESETRR